MRLTRRETSKLLMASAGFMGCAGPSSAFGSKPPDWSARLQYDLDQHAIPESDNTLSLVRFEMNEAKRVRMSCVIRLHWHPGARTRKFTVIGDQAEATYDALLNQALFEFGKVGQGCVV